MKKVGKGRPKLEDNPFPAGSKCKTCGDDDWRVLAYDGDVLYCDPCFNARFYVEDREAAEEELLSFIKKYGYPREC